MILILQLIAVILICDFISGIGHWLEDAYGNPNWKYLGESIIKPNLEHHQTPRSFLKRTYFYRNGQTILLAYFVTTFIYLTGWGNWQVVFGLLLLSQVNEFHAISHRANKENPLLVRWLQKIGLIQSRRHHGWHHKAPYDCRYCILTAYLNPVLDKLRFWKGLELFLSFFAIKPLRGTAARNYL